MLLLSSPYEQLAEEGTSRPPGLRWRNWRSALLAFSVSVTVCSIASFLLPSWLGYSQWLTPADGRWTVIGAQWVSHGAIGTIYSGDTMYLSLPGFLVLLAPVVALGDHLGLVTGYPFQLARPSMWVLVGPAFFVLGSSCLLGIDYLADTLGVTTGRRRIISLATGVVVVAPTCVWAGHPEDLVALGLSCVSLALLMRGRWLAAALVLSLAVVMQPWAGLLVLVVVAASPRGRRVRSLVWSSALPTACAAMLFVFTPSDTFRSLVEQPMLGLGQHLPWWGLSRPIDFMAGSQVIDARVGSMSRSVAVIVAILAAVLVWRRPSRSALMAAVSATLLARGVFETQFWCWYLAPAAVFMALGAASAPGGERRRWITGGVAAFVVYGFAAGSYDGYALPPIVALAVLLGAGGLSILMGLGSGRRSHDEGDLSAVDLELATTLDSLDGAVNYSAWIYDMVHPYLGERLLEVGAGHGTFTALLRGPSKTIVATEISPRSAERLRERFDGDHGVKVVEGDLASVQALGPFDSALLINVLEHIEDDEAALAELGRLLRPGGHLSIWVPALPALYSDFDRRVGHYRRYRLADLRRKLEVAGFVDTSLRYRNALGALVWLLTAKALRATPTRPGNVRAFDRFVVPVIRRVETHFELPFGQSIFATASRP